MSETFLQKEYKEKMIPSIMKALDIKNINSVPKIEKLVINIGIGSDNERTQALEEAIKTLKTITGQKPVETKAKLSISNFKLREGMSIGTKVTLRGKMMYDFLLRFIYVAVPTIRDFRGLPDRSFDGRGNYTVGISDHTIFPEIDLDKTTRHMGMDITFVTSAKDDKSARVLLDHFRFPFRKRDQPAKKQAEATTEEKSTEKLTTAVN